MDCQPVDAGSRAYRYEEAVTLTRDAIYPRKPDADTLGKVLADLPWLTNERAASLKGSVARRKPRSAVGLLTDVEICRCSGCSLHPETGQR